MDNALERLRKSESARDVRTRIDARARAQDENVRRHALSIPERPAAASVRDIIETPARGQPNTTSSRQRDDTISPMDIDALDTMVRTPGISPSKRGSSSPMKQPTKTRKKGREESPQKAAAAEGERRTSGRKRPSESESLEEAQPSPQPSIQNNFGRHLFAKGEDPGPDFSMVKLLDSMRTTGDSSVDPVYLSMNTLTEEARHNLELWWQYFCNLSDDAFKRWWQGLAVHKACLGCKVKSKKDSSWSGHFACSTCLDWRAKRPCFRMMDFEREDGTFFRDIQVLPQPDGSFGYWGAPPHK